MIVAEPRAGGSCSNAPLKVQSHHSQVLCTLQVRVIHLRLSGTLSPSGSKWQVDVKHHPFTFMPVHPHCRVSVKVLQGPVEVSTEEAARCVKLLVNIRIFFLPSFLIYKRITHDPHRHTSSVDYM